ncbi:uncharacterized protein LY89DRAFT_691025 [Mollisia scopiformis]|uniref:CorA-like transporter domain-containing protein n=1 Tax=Mollisia scopiformis TaxID=149040 RepID=A0A132B862_MOLSC|nr:uncharacterized protein LY89DRAFT_691025 [Mollisia scopiformis]KUJ08600.1 hypothetical protein LY89DRAFT_691025 [Mollisia scopiformis]
MDDEEEWPLSTKVSGPASSLYPDIVGHGIAFSEASPNLLSAAHVDIEACRIDKHGLESEAIESYDDLVFYFETSKSCHAIPDWDDTDLKTDSIIVSETSVDEVDIDHGAEAEIFFIRRMHAHTRLALSEQALKCLLSQHQVFSPLANILTSFSIGSTDYHEGSSGFYTNTTAKCPQGYSILELGYILKYVEPDAASLSPVPWSVRQMAIYQKVDTKTQETKGFVVQASTDVRRRKEEITQSVEACQDLSEHWTSLHLLIIGTINRNWELYLKSLDIGVDRLHNSLYAASLPNFTITSMQEVSKFVDLLIKFIHMLKLNMEVFNMLLGESRRPGGREEFDKTDFSCRYRMLEWAIDSTLSKTKLLCSHAELVLSRANNVVAMMRAFSTLQNNQFIHNIALDSNQSLQTIGHNTTRDDSNILPGPRHAPTREVPREARSTRTITLMMLVYLPLIFTSTFLSMGFIHVTSAHNGLIVRADDDMWFYLALTLPLSIVTLAVWYIWEWRARRRRMSRDLEENVKLE